MTRPDPQRDQRLAAALRDNLRRRKAQAREDPGNQASSERVEDSTQDPAS